MESELRKGPSAAPCCDPHRSPPPPEATHTEAHHSLQMCDLLIVVAHMRRQRLMRSMRPLTPAHKQLSQAVADQVWGSCCAALRIATPRVPGRASADLLIYAAPLHAISWSNSCVCMCALPPPTPRRRARARSWMRACRRCGWHWAARCPWRLRCARSPRWTISSTCWPGRWRESWWLSRKSTSGSRHSRRLGRARSLQATPAAAARPWRLRRRPWAVPGW